MERPKRVAWAVGVFYLALIPLLGAHAQQVSEDARQGLSFPEHAEVRQARAELLRAPLNELLQFPGAIEQRSPSGPVSVELRQNTDAVYLLFLHKIAGRYPVYGQGAYIIKRKRSDGSFVQLKIFLRTDPQFFVRVFPTDRGHAQLDLYLAGDRVYEGVRLPVSFQRVLRIPFADVMRMTRPMIRWDLVLSSPDPSRFAPLDRLENRIRTALAGGSSVDTSSGVASLLASWNSDEHGGAENIRKRVLSHFSRASVLGHAGAEISTAPFVRFIPGRGVRVEDLERLLYVLAVTEPGNGYAVVLEEAGARAARDAQGNQGRGMPRDRRNRQTASDRSRYGFVALPRITRTGSFEVSLFDSTGAVDIGALIASYKRWTARVIELPAIE